MYSEDWIIDVGGWDLAIERTFSGEPGIYESAGGGRYRHISGSDNMYFDIVYKHPHVVVFASPYPYKDELNLEYTPWEKLPRFNQKSSLQFKVGNQKYQVLRDSKNYPTVYIAPGIGHPRYYYHYDGSIDNTTMINAKPMNFKNSIHFVILASSIQ